MLDKSLFSRFVENMLDKPVKKNTLKITVFLALNAESQRAKKHLRHIIKIGISFTLIIFFPVWVSNVDNSDSLKVPVFSVSVEFSLMSETHERFPAVFRRLY